ncbi:MAG: hypothetical protein JXR29_13060 [Methylothermaceae bacterium]|nr:hypothetical protein [Methylothermaceae bacterium]
MITRAPYTLVEPRPGFRKVRREENPGEPPGHYRKTHPSRHHQAGPDQASAPRLRLELSAQTLLRLLENSQLYAADFRCLDCETHRWVRRLLVESCIQKLQEDYHER